MISQAIPNLAGNEARYLAECVETTFVSSVGPFVTSFERAVAEVSGCDDAVATSSGTCGLHAALVAVGVSRDDLVILPSYTFIASANAIAQCGASPWLFDIDEETWTLSPAQLARCLDQETEVRPGGVYHIASGRRVSAVMPVYTFGLPADMDRIVEIANEFGLRVIADGAAAIGSRYKKRALAQLGTDLTVYSFNGNKTVTAGGGGAVAGLDEELMAKVRHLTTTARRGPGYDHDEIGFNYRMTNIAAAVGCAQLELLDEFLTVKRRLRHTYNSALTHHASLQIFPDVEWAEGACWLSGFLTTDVATAEGLLADLRVADIDVRPFWKPMHLQKPFLSAPKSDLSVSEQIWQRIIVLPSSTGLSGEEIQQVISAVDAALA